MGINAGVNGSYRFLTGGVDVLWVTDNYTPVGVQIAIGVTTPAGSPANFQTGFSNSEMVMGANMFENFDILFNRKDEMHLFWNSTHYYISHGFVMKGCQSIYYSTVLSDGRFVVTDWSRDVMFGQEYYVWVNGKYQYNKDLFFSVMTLFEG